MKSCDTTVGEAILQLPVFSILMIQSGMVWDVAVPALAMSSTIYHGSASNSLRPVLCFLYIVLNTVFCVEELLLLHFVLFC